MRNLGGLAGALVLALATMTTGCLDDATTCADGSLCRGALVCAPVEIGGCAEPGQAEACVAPAVDGDACDYGFVSGVCIGGLCRLSACGDGIVDPTRGEVCDEGDNLAGDGCSADCRSDEVCGNGVIDDAVGEQCDDGNTNDHDGCQGTCVLQRCGDGVLDRLDDEVCDDGNNGDGDGCAADCGSDEVCGNGLVDWAVGEACDDGNFLAGDGCEADCAPGLLPRILVRSDAVPPVGRLGHVMISDLRRGQLLGFGGIGATRLDATLRWLGPGLVEQLPVATAPSARNGHAAAWDQARGEVVLFGGDGGLEGSLGDTWTWDGGSWRKRFPAVAPSPRRGHVMAFDPRSGAVLLFGGEAGGELLADTWAWDGETWTAQSATGPAARTAAAAVTDPVSGDVVLVGGRVAGGVSDEVWRWRAGAWSQVDGGPPARAAHALAAVPHALGEPVELVLFGGVDASGAALGDTWTWDGESWTEHAGTSPSAREGAAMAALPGANVLVLFGGLAAGNALRDTWRWAAGAWSSVPSGDATSNPGMGNAPVGWSPHHGAVVTMRYAGDGYVLLAYRRDHWEQVAGSPPQGSPIALQATADGTLHLLTSRYSGGTIFEVWTLAADNTWVLAATAPFSAGGYGTPWPMSIDPTTGGLLLRSVSSAELWRLDGGTWTALGDVFGVGVGGAVFSLAATADGVVAGLYVGGSSVVARYDGDSVASLPDVPNVNALGADLTRGTLFGAVYVSGSDWDIWQRSADGDRRTSLGATTFAPEHVVFDPVADRARGLSQDLTWYGAPAEACVDATDGDGDGLAGCDDPTCWAICTPLCPPGMACDEQAPHCGDGTCSAIETCAACAVDCGACVGGTCGDGRCDPDEAAGDGCPGDCGAA